MNAAAAAAAVAAAAASAAANAAVAAAAGYVGQEGGAWCDRPTMESTAAYCGEVTGTPSKQWGRRGNTMCVPREMHSYRHTENAGGDASRTWVDGLISFIENVAMPSPRGMH